MVKYDYKYDIGDTVKATCKLRVIDGKKGDGHTVEIEKEVEGKITNSCPLLVQDGGGKSHIEVWYDIIDPKDMVFHIKEEDVIE